MTDIAFNPGVSGASIGAGNGSAIPTSSSSSIGSVSVRAPVGGSLSTPTPGAKPEPFSKQEQVALDTAKNSSKLSGADADRWGHLERISVNAGKTDGSLKHNADTLQNKLRGNSEDVATYTKHVQQLEANSWSKVPFSDHNKELSWARTMLGQATKSLESTQGEIDSLLSRPGNLPYYRNAIDSPRR